MRKNAFHATEHISALNEFRKYSISSGNQPLSSDDFRAAFKACGIPSNPLFFLEFRNSGLLVRVEGNMYVWKNKLPIHYRTLQSIYSRYQKRANGYVRTHLEKKSRAKDLKSKEIESAISLLKDNGYEIFIPCKGLFKKV